MNKQFNNQITNQRPLNTVQVTPIGINKRASVGITFITTLVKTSKMIESMLETSLRLGWIGGVSNIVHDTCSWWRHQMETFSALLTICAGNSLVPGEFPTQRPVTRSFDVYFDLRLNERLCKQSWGWWPETLLCPLWRHSNVLLGLLSLDRVKYRSSDNVFQNEGITLKFDRYHCCRDACQISVQSDNYSLLSRGFKTSLDLTCILPLID